MGVGGVARAAGRIAISGLALPARSRQPGVPGLHRLARAHAACGVRGTGITGACGVAGSGRLHGWHSGQGAWSTVLDHAAGSSTGRKPARLAVRATLAAVARALPRGQHAGAALPRRLLRWGVRGKARVFDGDRHRSALDRRSCRHKCARMVLCAGPGRDRYALALTQSLAQRHRPSVGCDPGQRNRGGGARHRGRCPQALGVRPLLAHHRRGRGPLCLLPRLCIGGGLFTLPVDPVRGNDHHRRHGLAAGRVARRPLRHALSLRHRSRAWCVAGCAALRGSAVCRELHRVRPGDDPVSCAGATRSRRHLAAHRDLFRVVAVQVPPAGGTTAMSDALLIVEKLEVVYQRAITALQGVSLVVPQGQIVGILGTNGAGKTTLLRAISGFHGIDDARVTDGSISFKGKRIDNGEPHRIARAGIALVPEREKAFPNLTVAENLTVPVGPRASAAERRRLEDKVVEFFPKLGELRFRLAGLLSGGERQMLAIASALVCKPELLLIDELSLGLSPVVVDDLMARLIEIKRRLGITVVLVEQSAAVALELADYGYVLENGRTVLDGDAARLKSHADIQEFYLGRTSSGVRRSYRDVKQYRRSRRWYG